MGTIPTALRVTVASVAALAVLLGVLEVVFRVRGYYSDWYTDNYFVTFEPGTKFFREWDHTVRMPKPPGCRRVVTLGGSVTEGGAALTPFAE